MSVIRSDRPLAADLERAPCVRAACASSRAPCGPPRARRGGAGAGARCARRTPPPDRGAGRGRSDPSLRRAGCGVRALLLETLPGLAHALLAALLLLAQLGDHDVPPDDDRAAPDDHVDHDPG